MSPACLILKTQLEFCLVYKMSRAQNAYLQKNEKVHEWYIWSYVGNRIALMWYNSYGALQDRRASVILQMIIVFYKTKMSTMFLFMVMVVKHVIPTAC